MNSIIVTGGAGFIGSNFIYYLLSKTKGRQIVVYDLLTYAGNLLSLQDALRIQGSDSSRGISLIREA